MSRRTTSTPSLTGGPTIASPRPRSTLSELRPAESSPPARMNKRAAGASPKRFGGTVVTFRSDATGSRPTSGTTGGQTVASGSTTVTTASGKKTIPEMDQPRRDGLRLADEGRELQLGDAAGTRDPFDMRGRNGSRRLPSVRASRLRDRRGPDVRPWRDHGCKADRFEVDLRTERRRDVDAVAGPMVAFSMRPRRDPDHGLEDGPDLTVKTLDRSSRTGRSRNGTVAGS